MFMLVRCCRACCCLGVAVMCQPMCVCVCVCHGGVRQCRAEAPREAPVSGQMVVNVEPVQYVAASMCSG